MPASPPRLRRDLAVWMVALRRIMVIAGLAALVLQQVLTPGKIDLIPVAVVAAWIMLYNEVGRLLLQRVEDRLLSIVANVQIALDSVSLAALLHASGGLTNLGVLFFAPGFFAYGAVLPLGVALVHAAVTMLELGALGTAEGLGLLVRNGAGPYFGQAYPWPQVVAQSTRSART
jgi:uncharacterized membrane protein (DUF2068 family)